jgi:hypothetical protein
MEVGVQRYSSAALCVPGTHRIACWLRPRAGMDGCGNPYPHWVSLRRMYIPVTSGCINDAKTKYVQKLSSKILRTRLGGEVF